MNRTIKTAAFALAAMCAGVCMTVQAVTLQQIRERGTVRIAVANEIPYGYTDLSGNAKGVGPDVAKHIMQQLGITTIKWSTTNFGSLIPGLQAGRFDMVAAEMAVLPQRCKEVLFSEPDSSYGEGLLVAKGNPDNLHSYEAFAKSGHKIAILAGADQLDILQALGIPASQMVTISSNADAISTVAAGRASAYAATSVTTAALADKSAKVEVARNFSDPLVNAEPVRSWGAFAFAQGSEGFRDAVNAELEKFKKTQGWAKTMNHYGFSVADKEASFKKSTAALCGGL